MGAVGKGNSRTRPAELGYTPPVQNFVAWTDPESPFRSSCRIDGSVYARTY